MIITRSPMRIPLGGGGTDIPSFYKKYSSFFISAAIDYYIYICLKRRPIKGIRLGYSKIEEVLTIDQIDHKLIKACLDYTKTNTTRGIEIVSIGDLPAGTGMGSSGSFAVGLLKALYEMKHRSVSKKTLAEQACHVSMDILKEPSGKQDEYIASYGGITCFEVNKNGKVNAFPLKLSSSSISGLQKNLVMFYTGITRSTTEVLIKQKRSNPTENLQRIQEIGFQIKEALEQGHLTKFGKLLNNHWQVKKERAAVTSPQINKWYDIAMESGALGGKIMGAGGGGFFVFYCEDGKMRLRKSLTEEGLQEVKFHFDFEGSKVLVNK